MPNSRLNPHKARPNSWQTLADDAAKTAGELYGRAPVVIAAQQHASRLVVPASQQTRPISSGSHRDHAEKALAKLAGPHLPATLKQLKKAINATDREYNDRIAALSNPGERAHARAVIGAPRLTQVAVRRIPAGREP